MSWTNFLIEVILFSLLGFGYYVYQKKKIIRNTKLLIRDRVSNLLNEVDHNLNPDQIDQELRENKYTIVKNKIKNLAPAQEMEQIIKDLEEISRYS